MTTTPTASPRPVAARARLEGRTAIVTGSTSGIGAAIAHALAAEGARVLVSGRDGARGGAVIEAIRAAGGAADLAASASTASRPG